jgi:hypothetical protein
MSIGRAIMADTEEESRLWMDLETCKSAVIQNIFCQSSGALLDMRTVIVVEVTKGKSYSSLTLHPNAWKVMVEDGRADGLMKQAESVGATVRILDGAVLTKEGNALKRRKAAERKQERTPKE